MAPFVTAPHLRLLLQRHRERIHPVLDTDLNGEAVARLDFSARNAALPYHLDLKDTAFFAGVVEEMLASQGAEIGIGGYLEHRVIYGRSTLFGEEKESRCIHLGVDIWAKAGTPVFSPLPGLVHSLADNARFGDYGPTIILEHELEGARFYTLYGHLSRRSLSGCYAGKSVEAGERFADVGPFPENGDWPPHLHFQVITDMEGRAGDFPGVATPAEAAHFKNLCPDPNLILRSRHLGLMNG